MIAKIVESEMNWKAVIKELRAEAKRHEKVLMQSQGQPMVQQGAAITFAVIVAIANALEKGDMLGMDVDMGAAN
jgi:hypothetical protein